MSEEIYYADATELARRIRAKEVSPVEVLDAHLDRIEAVNPKLNAIVTMADDGTERLLGNDFRQNHVFVRIVEGGAGGGQS